MKLLNKIALGTVGAVAGVIATKAAVGYMEYRTENKVAENDAIVDRTEELNEKREQLNKKIGTLRKINTGLSYVEAAGVGMIMTVATAMALDGEAKGIGDNITEDINVIGNEIENESGNTIIGENIIIDQDEMV